MDKAKLLAIVKGKQAVIAAGKVRTVKLKPGKNRVVLMPGWNPANAEQFWHDFGQHYIKDGADELKAVVLCKNRTYGLPCEHCDAISRAGKAVDDATREILEKAYAKQGHLVNVLLPDSESPNDPQVLEVPKSVFEALLNLAADWGDQIFTKELSIVRDGKGLNTKYSASVSPAEASIPADSVKKMANLDEFVKSLENEEKSRQALLHVSSIAGLVTAGTGSDVPRTAPTAALSAPAAAAFPESGASSSGVDLTADVDEMMSAGTSSADALEAELDAMLKS